MILAIAQSIKIVKHFYLFVVYSVVVHNLWRGQVAVVMALGIMSVLCSMWIYASWELSDLVY